MSAVRLLVLGAVRRRGRTHGYQVRADLESWGAHEWARATSGSVYHALKALTRNGLLVVHDSTPSAAGGPPRVEYEITEAGDAEYLASLRTALAHRDPRLDVLAAAVGLIEDLPRAEAIGLLRDRATELARWRASITAELPSGTDLDTWGPVGAVVGLWLDTADSRTAWTNGLIERLESGAFRMADESV
ncbi:Transcriptional regulator PadR-like family [Nocardia otitidiscaviarum]|uniref:Transcriptional regulator PadR-like family n=1 Tax=Nocardia otitidiscaviarum TaxID=1823 RepID=A0A378YK44_9NOCA|nr:PadR family transcriptional regulator [Nocardia otitidiscaviarum]SUA77565.1 Transcriptional regulator PadR-like family [Nocardia otitidiscaviarum]